MSRGRRRASAAILVLALLVAGCSDSDPEKEAKPERSTGEEAKPERSTAEEVAASIGCEEVDVDDPVSGFQTSYVCRNGGGMHTQFHTFDARNRGSVERRYTTTIEGQELLPERRICPDGSPEPHWWYVVGDGWLAITGRDHVMDELVERYDGEILKSHSTPVTSGVDPCDK
jgi:hypothetical protein